MSCASLHHLSSQIHQCQFTSVRYLCGDYSAEFSIPSAGGIGRTEDCHIVLKHMCEGDEPVNGNFSSLGSADRRTGTHIAHSCTMWCTTVPFSSLSCQLQAIDFLSMRCQKLLKHNVDCDRKRKRKLKPAGKVGYQHVYLLLPSER